MFAGLTSKIARWSAQPAAVTIPAPTTPSARWGKSAAVPRHPVRVVGIDRETADAITLHLQPVENRPLRFAAGQYLTHCFEIDGVTVKRAYSISAAAGEQPACTIKTLDGGVVSRFVADHVTVGYSYPVIGPSGEFVLPTDPAAAATPLAFLAAGSGITPVMSMIETALRADPDRAITLVYASRRQSAIIFAQRLAALAAEHPGFTLTHVLSRPDAGWTGRTGRLDGQRAAQLLTARPDAEFYLCGPEQLMTDTAAALAAAAVPAGRVHQERFYAAARHTASLPTTAQPIEFRRSQLTIIAQPGETILEAGLRNGVPLDFSCTVGGCGACKVRVVSGSVTIDEPNCLTDAERAQGFTLGCSAYALEPAVIEA